MFVGGYLALNLYISGALLQTMGPRLESLSVFSYETAKAFTAEANFVFLFVPNPRNPVLLAAFAAVLVLTFIVSAPIVALLRRRSSCLNRIDSGEWVTIAVLAFTGVLFWASMVVLKFYRNFNTLDFRYLGPGTVLVTAAALSVLTAVGFSQRSWLRVATVLIVLTFVTYSGVFVPLRRYREQPTFFTERMEKTLTQYEHVPSGSVVLQGPPTSALSSSGSHGDSTPAPSNPAPARPLSEPSSQNQKSCLARGQWSADKDCDQARINKLSLASRP